MTETHDDKGARLRRGLALAGGGLGLALIGGFVGAGLRGGNGQSTVNRIAPAIRIVRPQAAQTSPADIVDQSCPSVVSIVAANTEDGPAGAGFLAAPNGVVLSVASAVPDGDLTVRLSDGRSFAAQRIGADPVSGLVLLKIDAPDLPWLNAASADLPRVGSPVLALTAPNGSGCAAMPAIVGSDFLVDGGGTRSYVRAAPPFGPDQAGAPVLDQNGQVLGIVTAPTSGKAAEAPSILPAVVSAPIVAALLRSEPSAAARYGLELGDVTPGLATRLDYGRERGAMLAMVSEHGPAAKAGLEAGDIVLSVNDTPVSSASEAMRLLGAEPAAPATLQVLHSGDRKTVTIKPSPPPRGSAGS